MANYMRENVIFVDTDGYTKPGNTIIDSVFYKGNTSGEIKIRQGTASNGAVLYENDGTDDDHFDTCIRSKDGIYVEVANGASIYIYLK